MLIEGGAPDCGGVGGVVGQFRMRGFVRAQLLDRDGNVVSERRTANLVVNGGRAEIMKLISTTGAGDRISHGQVGTGAGATAATDTGLVSATGTRRALGISLNVGTVDYTFSYPTTDVNSTLQEVALWNSSSGGVMIARATHGAIVKDTTMTLAYTYQLQLQTAA